MRGTKILELGMQAARCSILIAIAIAKAFGQNPGGMSMLEFRYGYHVPMADMADRFGGQNDISAAFTRAHFPGNVFVGAEGLFFFGSSVKEDVLAPLRSYDGSIIDRTGSPADINL